MIATVFDSKRGCGWRKPGGLYLMGGTESETCGKFPIPLTVCKYCGAGIKITRSLQKINVKMLTENVECTHEPESCATCPMNSIEWAYMMSVGEKFYKLPDDFLREAAQLGISKRIHAIPRGFKVGESYIALAHHKGMTQVIEGLKEHHSVEGDPKTLFYGQSEDVTEHVTSVVYLPAIFTIFRPTRIEYVVKGTETEEEIAALEARGIQPVQVLHKEVQIPLPDLDDGEPETVDVPAPTLEIEEGDEE